MKKLIHLWISISVCVILVAPNCWASEARYLPEKWQFQPATDSKTMPVETLWSAVNSHYLKATPPAGTSWQMTKEKTNDIWMRQSFELSASEVKNARFILDFERINGNAIVFVNGSRVGERLGPYGQIEITSFVRVGVNELLLFNTRNYTDMSRTFETDPLRYTTRALFYKPLPIEQWALGINHVRLVRYPLPAAISNVWVETSVRKQLLTLHIETDNRQALPKALVSCEVLDQEGKNVLQWEEQLSLAGNISEHTVQSAWKDPILWELDRGYCYQAVVTIKTMKGKVIDTHQVTFGFREIWTEGRQLILNGHPCRWRTESSFGLNEASVSFFKMLGRNMMPYAPTTANWWRMREDEVPLFEHSELDLMDREGIATLLPALTCYYFGARFLTDTVLQQQYKEETARYFRQYRNHPCILAWSTGMNSFNPKDAIHPETIGQRSEYIPIQAAVLNKSFDFVREADPTRLVYSHADGNLGDLANSNTYPNFMPVQEVEDYLEEWTKKGDMPWWACEYAAIYNGSYFKNKQLLLTEYAAIYFGEDAYQRETEKQLEKTMELSIKDGGHGNTIPEALKDSCLPVYYDLQRLYVGATDKGWRADGGLGWLYFNFSVGYGDPTEYGNTKPSPFSRYSVMKEPVTTVPSWVNPQFDMHAKYMQPLLAYIGGFPRHSDKTHAFYGNERVRKSLTLVWDGPDDLWLNANWALQTRTGEKVCSGSISAGLKVGDIKVLPFVFKTPAVTERTDYQLTLRMEGWRETVYDTLAIQVFPEKKVLKSSQLDTRFWVNDPYGYVMPWLKTVATHVKELKEGQSFQPGDVIIFARGSLRKGMTLPVTPENVASGVRVVFLEQEPGIYDKIGIRSMDAMSRFVFPGTDPGTILEGLKPCDLCNWRGEATLIHEFQKARATDVTTAPRGSNRGIVASTVMEIPVAAGFEPLLVAEFDMSYTPLMRMSYGKGAVYFSTFDFTERLGIDPAATRLAENLLYTAATYTSKQEEVLLATEITAPDMISRILNKGGTVVYVGLDKQALSVKGIRTEKQTLYRVPEWPTGRFVKMTPLNTLRWRDTLSVALIRETGADAGGLFWERPFGNGREVFVQASPAMLVARYPDENGEKNVKQAAMELSVVRLKQLVSQVLTGYGAQVPEAIASRVLTVSRGISYRDLNGWSVLGPFYTGAMTKTEILEKAWPGEEQALRGDLNPNFTYLTDDGRQLDFRKTVYADAKKFLNLGYIFAPKEDNALGYAVKIVEADEARKAILRLGVDYYAKVYVNGEQIFNKDYLASAVPDAFSIPVRLKQGENVIVVKCLAGNKGFGFWANLSEPDADLDEALSGKERVPIYDTDTRFVNPYSYNYW
ncbi:MAG: glycoside hydrolase family 2 TIM barrel-domain containing protein [Mangrovibacterium sp.]